MQKEEKDESNYLAEKFKRTYSVACSGERARLTRKGNRRWEATVDDLDEVQVVVGSVGIREPPKTERRSKV